MYHLDNLRRSKKITVEKFCEGICSDRQYRRLLSGEQNISDQKISEFCNKLGISTIDFYYSANEKDKYEYSKIAKLYNHLLSRQYEDFKTKYKKIKIERLVNKQNKRFFTFTLLKYQYLTGNIKDSDCIDDLSKLCNYPECIKFKTFDFVDIISLQIIAEIEVKNDKKTALTHLSKILTSKDMVYISSESRHILPNIYGTVSILLSRLKLHDESLRTANSGINYSILHSDFSTLTHLYYSKAYTLLEMNQVKQAQISAAKCLSNAISRGIKSEYDIFYNLIEKNFNIEPLLLFQTYKDKLI